MLTGSLDQWAVKFRVSFGRPNWCTIVIETEARSTRQLRFESNHRSYFIICRGSSEFSIKLSKLKS